MVNQQSAINEELASLAAVGTSSMSPSEGAVKAPSIFEKVQAAALPLMTDYQSDLVCDRDWIAANEGLSFIHVTRSSGTHIFALPVMEDLLLDKEEPHLFGVSRPSEIYSGIETLLAKELAESGLLFQVYDGRRLRTRTREEGLEDYRQALSKAEAGVKQCRRKRAAHA